MSKSDYERNLDARAQLFKALGHPVRLLIINLIAQKPRHGQELAAILNLKAATISHHLSKLAEVGLLTSQKEQYYQVYSLEEGLLDRPLRTVIQMAEPKLDKAVEVDAYTEKVLRSFFRHGRLTKLPSQYKKQRIVLEQLVQEFDEQQKYHEFEVNRILLEFHEDVAALRRGFIDHGLMTRENNIYWRIQSEE